MEQAHVLNDAPSSSKASKKDIPFFLDHVVKLPKHIGIELESDPMSMDVICYDYPNVYGCDN